jgi:hypothetical protein
MLEENTECWICKRTEAVIINGIKRSGWSEELFEEIRKVNAEEGKSTECTKEGVITLEDVGQLGLSSLWYLQGVDIWCSRRICDRSIGI